MPRIREIDRFDAVSDTGAHKVTIVITEEVINVGALDGAAEMGGMKSAWTVDGNRCNYVSPDRFLIVAANVEVSRVTAL